jgi:phosphohistidine phosphatase SixA
VKRLTLMRHANAEWKDPQLSDFERPLNRRGQSEAEAMGRRFVEMHLVPTIVLTSPARRAQQTADIMVREVGIPPRNLRMEESLYLAPAEEILRIIQSTGPRILHLMIVGHNHDHGGDVLVELRCGQLDRSRARPVEGCSQRGSARQIVCRALGLIRSALRDVHRETSLRSLLVDSLHIQPGLPHGRDHLVQ